MPKQSVTSENIANYHFLVEEEKTSGQKTMQSFIGFFVGMTTWATLNRGARYLVNSYILLPLATAILNRLPSEDTEENKEKVVLGFSMIALSIGIFLLNRFEKTLSKAAFETFPFGIVNLKPSAAFGNINFKHDELIQASNQLKARIKDNNSFNSIQTNLILGIILANFALLAAGGFLHSVSLVTVLTNFMLLQPFKNISNYLFRSQNELAHAKNFSDYIDNIKTIFNQLDTIITHSTKDKQTAVISFPLHSNRTTHITINDQQYKIKNDHLAKLIHQFCAENDLLHYVYENKIYLYLQKFTGKQITTLSENFLKLLSSILSSSNELRKVITEKKQSTALVTHSLADNENKKQVSSNKNHHEEKAQPTKQISYTQQISQKTTDNVQWILSGIQTSSMTFLSQATDHITNDINKRTNRFLFKDDTVIDTPRISI